MTVKIIQRKPDRDTLERHEYIKRGIVNVKVYQAFNGDFMARLEKADGKAIHMNLFFFDFEIQ